MKKRHMIAIALALSVSFLSSPAFSNTQFCRDRMRTIDWELYGLSEKYEFLDAIANYADPAEDNYNSETDRYELCFKFQHSATFINDTIIISANPLDKDLAIFGIIDDPSTDFGIHIFDSTPTGEPLIAINDFNVDRTVTIENLNLKNVEDGVYAYDSTIELIDPVISGIGGGSCILLDKSDGSIIIGGDISGCDIGIQLGNDIAGPMTPLRADNTTIGASQWDAFEDYTSIHDNGIGIYLIQGDKNMWPYVSIYGNMSNPPEKTSEDGITVEEGENDGIQAPTLVKQLVDGKYRSIVCKKDEGLITSRKFFFDGITEAGEITFFTIDSIGGFPQGKTYAVRCDVDTDGVCELVDINPNNTEAVFSEHQCGIDNVYLAAVYTGQSGNSSSYATELVDIGDFTIFTSSPDAGGTEEEFGEDGGGFVADGEDDTGGDDTWVDDTGQEGNEDIASLPSSSLYGGISCSVRPNAPDKRPPISLLALLCIALSVMILRRKLAIRNPEI